MAIKRRKLTRSWELGASAMSWSSSGSELELRSRCRYLRHDPAQADDADQVREHLQRVHQVAPRPHDLDPRDRAERNQQAVDPAIRHRDLAAEDVLEELLAVVGPADERRVAEEERAERDDAAADDGHDRVEAGGDGGGARQRRTATRRSAGSSSREIVDVTNETMNVSITAFSPCCAGCVLCAVP